MRDYVHKCAFKSVVLGLSGGIDSALVAVIAAEALGPKQVWGVSLPSRYSSEGSLSDAAHLAKTLGIKYDVLPIEGPVLEAETTLTGVFAGRTPDLTEENIQSRMRGLLLMALSNKFGPLVLTTGNKSELAVGYCTLYGDMCGALAVIADVLKARNLRAGAMDQSPRGNHSMEDDREAAERRVAPEPDRPGQPAALRCTRPHPASLRG